MPIRKRLFGIAIIVLQALMQFRFYKVLIYSFFMFLFAILLILFLLYYYLFYPFTPSEVHIPSTGAKVLNKPISRGDNVFFEIEFCNVEKRPTIIIYSIISLPQDNQFGKLISIPYTHSHIPSQFDREELSFVGLQQCSIFIDTYMKIPENAPLGIYHGGITVKTEINKLRTIDTFFELEPFEVIEATRSAK